MSEVITEPATNSPPSKSQPIAALANLDPQLDDAQVRQAISDAEANNLDPQTLRMDELAQGQSSNPPAKPVEVPQKFLKPDGAVDVDKIQASTRQLDEAIQKKEEAISKSVDDYMQEYNGRETKFRNMPNPQRLAVLPPVAPPPQAPTLDAPQNFEEIVRRDYAVDPLGTTTRLMDLMLKQKFQPMEEREKAEATRSNLQALVAKDPRVLREDVFAAVNAKLAEWEIDDPARRNQKNPHRAAWLEVKEELRLGELPQGAPAQPRLSPVLGGGTPPSAPSSSVPSQTGLASLAALDLRDKKQEALGDEAVRRALMGDRG